MQTGFFGIMPLPPATGCHRRSNARGLKYLVSCNEWCPMPMSDNVIGRRVLACLHQHTKSEHSSASTNPNGRFTCQQKKKIIDEFYIYNACQQWFPLKLSILEENKHHCNFQLKTHLQTLCSLSPLEEMSRDLCGG